MITADGYRARIPIVIGVTGHRDVVDSAECDLAKQITQVLHDLAERYPHSELILLSALAEGADRLAAQAALASPRVSLVVPLPMRQGDYEREFSSADSVAEFRKLLAQAESWFELPVAGVQYAHDDAASGVLRQPYGELGWYIARHSHLLLALWDGDDADGTSGTAKVVSLNLHGLPRPDEMRGSLIEPAGIGPVYHIQSPRRNKPAAGNAAYTLRILLPAEPEAHRDVQALYSRILTEIDDYNHEAMQLERVAEDKLGTSHKYLTGGIDLAGASLLLQAVAWRYAHADVLATKYKRLQQRAVFWLAALASVGFAALEIYDQLLVDYPWGLMVLMGFPLALLLAVRSISNSALFHDKYLGYRALAEAVRVQYFWLALGAKWRVPDHYLDKHRGELRWVRWAIMAWVMPIGQPGSLLDAGLPVSLQERARYVLEHWAKDQASYFRRRIASNRKRCSSCEIWRTRMFRSAVVVSLIVLLTQAIFFLSAGADAQRSLIESILVLVVALAFVIGGAIAHYEEKMTFAEELWQYNLAQHRFTLACELIAKAATAGRLDVAQELIHELGQEALWENADWVQLHQQRPPSVPQA